MLTFVRCACILLFRRSDFDGVNVENADFTDVLPAWMETFRLQTRNEGEARHNSDFTASWDWERQ